MDCTAQNRPEDNPQEYHRSEAGAHQSSEYRACARDVQKLHQICFPGLHGDVVDSILKPICRSLPLIGGEDLFNESAVHQIAGYKDAERNDERYHDKYIITYSAYYGTIRFK